MTRPKKNTVKNTFFFQYSEFTTNKKYVFFVYSKNKRSHTALRHRIWKNKPRLRDQGPILLLISKFHAKRKRIRATLLCELADITHI